MMPAAGAWDRARGTLGGPTLALLVLLVLLRLVLLVAFPLGYSEGRYAEIARKMVEFDDWVTPWYAVGVPFWGKPPLATWLSAAGIELLGVNPLAVRLPHFLIAVVIIGLTVDWARRSGVRQALYVVPLLAGSLLFLVASGAVLTDMALCLGATLAIRGFWLAVNGPEAGRRSEARLFFLGLAFMLLAKGPVGWVLVLAPIAAWTLWTRSAARVWRALPWPRGLLIAACLAAPWYALAETRTPGFLQYFLVGEHWHRFTVPGWKGDLYGSAHAYPRGSIWLFAVVALVPWSIVFPAVAWLTRSSTRLQRGAVAQAPAIALYCLMCALAPCIVFTLAGNILWTYVLPGLPPLALWAATWLERREAVVARRSLFIGTACAGAILGVALAMTAIGGLADRSSAAAVVGLYRSQLHPEIPLIFWGTAPPSAAFYTAGQALTARNAIELADIRPGNAVFVAVPKADHDAAVNIETLQLQPIGDGGEFRLLLRPSATGTAPVLAKSLPPPATESKPMRLAAALVDRILHIDVHLAGFVAQHGWWVYALIFAIVFVETGLVVMPFLPGDSLLFVVGALCATGAMSLPLAIALLILAAVSGDQLNFTVGHAAGRRAFAWEQSLLFNKRAFDRTHAFYEKYGAITIVLARFLPFVRTFAPFVAGIASMNRSRFTRFNILGAVLWITALVSAGFLLGNLPLIQRNMSVVIWAFVLIPGAMAIGSALRVRMQGP